MKLCSNLLLFQFDSCLYIPISHSSLSPISLSLSLSLSFSLSLSLSLSLSFHFIPFVSTQFLPANLFLLLSHLISTCLLISAEQQASPACKSSAKKFICRYYFPLCNCLTGETHVPLQEDCWNLQYDVCYTEWIHFQIQGYGNILPDCRTLPSNKEG